MKKQSKILLTDINADRDRENALIKYQKLLAFAFEKYATIKMSLNLFTMYEKSEDISMDRREEVEGYIDLINTAIREVIVEKTGVDSETLSDISNARDTITSRMKVLTAYTDALEIYEYMLNRREPEVQGTVDETIDVGQLANNMYEFVFSENDKMLINTRIQEFIAQLPVRMTKNRFFDIISNSLAIYRGGEQKAVREFIETIKDASLMDLPKGFDSDYPRLYEIYKALKDADYQNIDKSQYNELSDMLTEATSIIESAVTDYMMLIEIINDILIILYTDSISDKSYADDHYNTSSKILAELVKADDIYQASEQFNELFVSLEGVQESSYEELAFIESNLDDLYATYYEMYENENIKERFDNLLKADKLTSTSLFMDIDDDRAISVVVDEADDVFISEEKTELLDDFEELFKTISRYEKRSIMAKVLSLMPVFFNTQQEIRDYFEYALSSCNDKAELTACRDIVNDLMM